MKKLLLIGGVLSLIGGVQVAQAATYNVTQTFEFGDMDTIFTGSFDFTGGMVSGLNGTLTEPMMDPIEELTLMYQLSSVPVTLGGVNGLLVTTFLNNSTSTFTTSFGGDGWAPGSGFGLHAGFPVPANNPGNAYAMIFVNTTDPTTPLAQAQIDKLAYADCAPGGMMTQTCSTGTTVAGYGTIGTMNGYPVSQTITKP